MVTAKNDGTKVLVSFERYTELLNEELSKHPEYPVGLKFVHLESGFDLVDSTGARPVTEIMSICKAVDDIVARRFCVARH